MPSGFALIEREKGIKLLKKENMFKLVFFKIIKLTMNCISLKSYAPKIRELDKIRQNHCLRTRLAVVKKKLCKINYLFMNLFLAFNKGRQRAGGEANCQT